MSRLFEGEIDMERAGELMMPGLSLRWYSILDSTNAAALRESDLPQGTVIAADCQEAGRGRLGRSWQSPAGLNLYFSIVLYPRLPRLNWGGFSLAAGAGLAQGLAELELKPGLKWPNDLLVDGAKLAGILLESRDAKLVVGVGVNVNQEKFPRDIRATSIRLATGREWRRDQLLALVCREVYRSCLVWDQHQFDRVLWVWREHSTILGHQLTVIRGGETITGRAVDLDTDGALIIQDSDGNRHVLHSGEVTLSKKKRY